MIGETLDKIMSEEMRVTYATPVEGLAAKGVLRVLGVSRNTDRLCYRVWRVYFVEPGSYRVMIVSDADCKCTEYCECEKALMIVDEDDYVIYRGDEYQALYRLGLGPPRVEIADSVPSSEL